MTFWSSNALEPKRNYRFLVTIGTDSTTMQGNQWWAKTVETPSFDVTEVEHNFYDNKYYYPGRAVWNEIAMTIVDPKSVNMVWNLNSVLSSANYKVKQLSDIAKPISISKLSANTALGAVTIYIYDADGVCIERWSLKNAFLKSAKFGSLDYSNDELRQVDLTIRYDWATVAKTAAGEDELHTLAAATEPENPSTNGDGLPEQQVNA